MALHFVQHRRQPRAVGALEVRELDDRHRRIRRPTDREPVGRYLDAQRRQQVRHRVAALQLGIRRRAGVLDRLAFQVGAYLRPDLSQRLGDAALPMEGAHLGVGHRLGRFVNAGGQRLGRRSQARCLHRAQPRVHQVAQDRLQRFVPVALGVQLAPSQSRVVLFDRGCGSRVQVGEAQHL